MQQATKYTKEEIMRKVKGLLANAEGHKGKNEHLAAAFAVKVQQLMQSWNIQENELHTEDSNVGFVEYRFKSKRKWQKFLLDAVCKTNFLDWQTGVETRLEEEIILTPTERASPQDYLSSKFLQDGLVLTRGPCLDLRYRG